MKLRYLPLLAIWYSPKTLARFFCWRGARFILLAYFPLLTTDEGLQLCYLALLRGRRVYNSVTGDTFYNCQFSQLADETGLTTPSVPKLY